MRNIRTYSEMMEFQTFEERFEYLKLGGAVGAETFGFDRIFNQQFYRSKEWRAVRNQVIIRDNGCDLGVEGHDIYGSIYIHHLNPIALEDITDRTNILLNPEYLVCTSFATHNAIHYGDFNILPNLPPERSKNDTCPWKK